MAEAGLEPKPDYIAHPFVTGPHSIPTFSRGGEGQGSSGCPAQGIICVNKETVLSLSQVLQAGGGS